VLKRSIRWRLVSLAAALLWAGGAVAVILWLPVHSGVLTTQGVELRSSLYAQDPSGWPLNFGILGATVLGGTVDLAIRARLRITGPGVLALIAAGLLLLYSLFGLLQGVLGFGPIAVFVALSALPLRFAPGAVPGGPMRYPATGSVPGAPGQ
jgi:hypothetical protein